MFSSKGVEIAFVCITNLLNLVNQFLCSHTCCIHRLTRTQCGESLGRIAPGLEPACVTLSRDVDLTDYKYHLRPNKLNTEGPLDSFIWQTQTVGDIAGSRGRFHQVRDMGVILSTQVTLVALLTPLATLLRFSAKKGRIHAAARTHAFLELLMSFRISTSPTLMAHVLLVVTTDLASAISRQRTAVFCASGIFSQHLSTTAVHQLFAPNRVSSIKIFPTKSSYELYNVCLIR